MTGDTTCKTHLHLQKIKANSKPFEGVSINFIGDLITQFSQFFNKNIADLIILESDSMSRGSILSLNLVSDYFPPHR